MGTLCWWFLLPAGGEICDRDLAHHVAQPRSGFHSRVGGRSLDLLIECRGDVEREVANRAFCTALGACECVPTAQPPVHNMAQDRRARLMEACGQLVHFRPRWRVQASIDTDTGAWLRRLAIERLVHRSPVVLTNAHPLAIGARAFIGLSLNPRPFPGRLAVMTVTVSPSATRWTMPSSIRWDRRGAGEVPGDGLPGAELLM